MKAKFKEVPNNIKDLIPPQTTETSLFQAWVDQDLLVKVKRQRDKDNISWRDLCEACFKRYLMESGVKPD